MLSWYPFKGRAQAAWKMSSCQPGDHDCMLDTLTRTSIYHLGCCLNIERFRKITPRLCTIPPSTLPFQPGPNVKISIQVSSDPNPVDIPLNPGWLITGSLFHGLWNIITNKWDPFFIPDQQIAGVNWPRCSLSCKLLSGSDAPPRPS